MVGVLTTALPWREVSNGGIVIGDLATNIRLAGEARFLVASLEPLQAFGGNCGVQMRSDLTSLAIVATVSS